MHSRSFKTVDPRIPMYHAGTEHAGFSPTRQTSRAPRAKRREVHDESRMKGQLPPAKNLSCKADFRALCVPSFVWGWGGVRSE